MIQSEYSTFIKSARGYEDHYQILLMNWMIDYDVDEKLLIQHQLDILNACLEICNLQHPHDHMDLPYVKSACAVANEKGWLWLESVTNHKIAFLTEKLNSISIKSNYTSASNDTRTTKKKIAAKYYALTYLVECHINGEKPLLGEKVLLEKEGNKRMGAGRGNTFYKNVNKLSYTDLDDVEKLDLQIGYNWYKTVILISEQPDKIKQYYLPKLNQGRNKGD